MKIIGENHDGAVEDSEVAADLDDEFVYCNELDVDDARSFAQRETDEAGEFCGFAGINTEIIIIKIQKT